MNLKINIGLILLVLFSHSVLLSQQQDLSQYEKRLAEIANQIENLKGKIKREEKRESSVLAQLGKLGFQKKLILNEIALYNTQLRRANSELVSIENRIPELEAQLARGKDSIEKILVTLYKYGKLKYFEFMLQADNVGKLLSQNKNLQLLAQHQEKIISNFLATLNELNASREGLEAKRIEIDQLLQKANSKKQELEAQERKNQNLIRRIAQNKKLHLQTLEELRERANQLQNLMNKLIEDKIALPFALIPLYEKKGKLTWPILGKVVTRFGLNRHPKFNTITMNNGIEILSQKNSVIKSIHPGLVVYTDYFQGYGNLIIVDHGMSYYSLYGHCSEFLTKKGDAVNAEQPIAIIGDIGSLKGVTLYLEIRYRTKPLNPLQWLKRR